MARCPNCEQSIPWDADVCPLCNAQFSTAREWRPQPELPGEEGRIAARLQPVIDAANRRPIVMSGMRIERDSGGGVALTVADWHGEISVGLMLVGASCIILGLLLAAVIGWLWAAAAMLLMFIMVVAGYLVPPPRMVIYPSGLLQVRGGLQDRNVRLGTPSSLQVRPGLRGYDLWISGPTGSDRICGGGKGELRQLAEEIRVRLEMAAADQ